MKDVLKTAQQQHHQHQQQQQYQTIMDSIEPGVAWDNMEMTTESVEDSSESSGSDMEEEEFNGKIRELKKYVS